MSQPGVRRAGWWGEACERPRAGCHMGCAAVASCQGGELGCLPARAAPPSSAPAAVHRSLSTPWSLYALIVASAAAPTDLRRVDLRDADLAGAWLNDSNLARAELADVDLRGANLEGAILVQARLRRTSLEGAVLTGADLREADLRGADVDNAALAGAVADAATQWPDRFDWQAAGVVMEPTSGEEHA